MAIGARHITVSTSGLAHKIREFANEGVQVNLAVSLHAPNNELRSSIMKINCAFPIEKLFAAIEYYIETTNRRVTFEYIMLNEVNDGVEQALELAELLENIKKLSYVNLIPYNPVSEHDQYSRSPKRACQWPSTIPSRKRRQLCCSSRTWYRYRCSMWTIALKYQ